MGERTKKLAGDPAEQLICAVAEAFGKLPHEVEQLPVAEFDRCVAWVHRPRKAVS